MWGDQGYAERTESAGAWQDRCSSCAQRPCAITAAGNEKTQVLGHLSGTARQHGLQPLIGHLMRTATIIQSRPGGRSHALIRGSGT